MEFSIPEIRKLPPFRKVLLFAYDAVTSLWEELHQTDGSLHTLPQGGNPPVPTQTTLATHNFTTVNPANVLQYDPTPVDVEGYRGVAFWVQESAGANPLSRVAAQIFSGLGGTGIVSYSPSYNVPAAMNVQCLTTMMPFGWSFGDVVFVSSHAIKSLAFGVRLTAAVPQETITVEYIGLRF